MMMTWSIKLAASLAGSFMESDATYPRLISLTGAFFTLKPTLSPGRASRRDSWCISTDFTSVVRRRAFQSFDRKKIDNSARLLDPSPLLSTSFLYGTEYNC
ncbi:uncharacterized protein [Spinacia oleracea]|uniref:Secreted protein n=1 Tax=Spinacia oleracea TaxID=3562 RepID=A0A9R0IR27_SPIOL|nr:uncharacterized protein LOC110792499 [Spinacia oleracea]